LCNLKCKVLFTKRKIISEFQRILMSDVLYGFFQSGDIFNAGYETNWYENSLQIKHLLRTMIMRASKPVKAKAGLIGTIDIPLFATVRKITNTHTHIYVQSYIHTYVHTHIHTYIHMCTHSFIHSFSSLSYDRSKASSKASSPHSAIQSFLL